MLSISLWTIDANAVLSTFPALNQLTQLLHGRIPLVDRTAPLFAFLAREE